MQKDSIKKNKLKNYNSLTLEQFNSTGRDVIVNGETDLNYYILEAINDCRVNKTIHFGIIDFKTIKKIKDKIMNLPVSKRNMILNSDYDLAINQSEIRHIKYGKNLNVSGIQSVVSKLPLIITSCDYVSYTRNNKGEGLRFKKVFEDGTYISFIIISNKKKRFSAKTVYIEKIDFEKSKKKHIPNE